MAALRSAGLGVLTVMVLVLVAWAGASDSGADAPDAVATALQAWLVGHHAHLAVPGGELALVPLGLTLLPLVLLHTATLRAGRAAGIRGRTGVIALTASVTATYAVVATFVALLARTDAVQALPTSAFVGAAGVAALGSGSGAIRATGTWSGVTRRLPPLVRTALPAATAALATLVAGGALLAGGSLAVHHDQAALLVDGLDAGIGGGILLAALCLLYVPTAAVWGLAYVVGPGFAVGAGTSVSDGRHRPRCRPGLPAARRPAAGAGAGVGTAGAGRPAARRRARRRCSRTGPARGRGRLAAAGRDLRGGRWPGRGGGRRPDPARLRPGRPGPAVRDRPDLVAGRPGSPVSRSRWSWPRRCGPCAAVPPDAAN